MKGVWLHNKDIDLKQWDKLVKQTPHVDVFSTSHYLTAVCPNWWAYVSKDYRFGIPVGVNEKLGIRSIYTPNFLRYTEPLGEPSQADLIHFQSSLLKNFKIGNLNFKSNILKEMNAKEFVYQQLTHDKFKIKTQARRMLTKFNKSALKVELNNQLGLASMSFIKAELGKKLPIYSKPSAQALNRIISDLPQDISLITYVIRNEKEICGTVIGLDFNHKVLYLKGATNSDVKKEGGMYALMHQLIEHAFKSGKEFDFGGSRVEGVRFFNTRFNATDRKYYCYHWDQAPKWFRQLKRINQWIKK